MKFDNWLYDILLQKANNEEDDWNLICKGMLQEHDLEMVICISVFSNININK